MFIVYILHSSSIDKYYVGYTNDLERRLLERNRKKENIPMVVFHGFLVHKEEYALKSEAMAREKQIKQQKSRQYILSILSS